MEDCGLVSIIMTIYNAERYIKDAIELALKQTYPNFEFIIVKDGSKDRTLEIAKSFKDERIKIIDLKENSSVSHACNVALDMVKGKWVAFIDADDIWKSERLQYPLNLSSKYEYGKYFIADNVTICSKGNKGQLIPYSSVSRWKTEIPKMLSSNDIAENLYFYAKLQKCDMRMLLTKESFYFYRLTLGSLPDLSSEDLKHNCKYKEFKKFLLKGNLKKALEIYLRNHFVLKMLIVALLNPRKVLNYIEIIIFKKQKS